MDHTRHGRVGEHKAPETAPSAQSAPTTAATAPAQGSPPANAGYLSTNQTLEAGVLQNLDTLQNAPGVDSRWLSIARTHIEQGFMAMNRAVMPRKGQTTVPSAAQAPQTQTPAPTPAPTPGVPKS